MSEIDLTENTSVLYSQEVSAEDLNNMVIDLGLTDFTKFENGTETAVTRLNNITKALVTEGILQSGSMCKVTVSGNYIYVSDGVCVFEDGSKVRLENSYTLTKYSGTNFVYLAKAATGGAKLINSTTELSATDYAEIIPLATVSADGAVTDKRIRARALFDNKNGVNETETINIGTITTGSNMSDEYWIYFEDSAVSYDLKYTGYNYVVVTWGKDKERWIQINPLEDVSFFLFNQAGEYNDALFEKNGNRLKITPATYTGGHGGSFSNVILKFF